MAVLDFQRCCTCGGDLSPAELAQTCSLCGRPSDCALDWTVLDSQSFTVRADVSCIQCGYNLRALPLGSACPECGVSIHESLRPDHLAAVGPVWIRRMRTSLLLLAVVLLSMSAGKIDTLLQYAGIVIETPIWIALTVNSIVAVITGFGVFGLCPPPTRLLARPWRHRLRVFRLCVAGHMFLFAAVWTIPPIRWMWADRLLPFTMERFYQYWWEPMDLLSAFRGVFNLGWCIILAWYLRVLARLGGSTRIGRTATVLIVLTVFIGALEVLEAILPRLSLWLPPGQGVFGRLRYYHWQSWIYYRATGLAAMRDALAGVLCLAVRATLSQGTRSTRAKQGPPETPAGQSP